MLTLLAKWRQFFRMARFAPPSKEAVAKGVITVKTAAQFTVLIERRMLQRLFAVFMTTTLLAVLLGFGSARAQPVSWGTRGKVARD